MYIQMVERSPPVGEVLRVANECSPIYIYGPPNRQSVWGRSTLVRALKKAGRVEIKAVDLLLVFSRVTGAHVPVVAYHCNKTIAMHFREDMNASKRALLYSDYDC